MHSEIGIQDEVLHQRSQLMHILAWTRLQEPAYERRNCSLLKSDEE